MLQVWKSASAIYRSSRTSVDAFWSVLCVGAVLHQSPLEANRAAHSRVQVIMASSTTWVPCEGTHDWKRSMRGPTSLSMLGCACRFERLHYSKESDETEDDPFFPRSHGSSFSCAIPERSRATSPCQLRAWSELHGRRPYASSRLGESPRTGPQRRGRPTFRLALQTRDTSSLSHSSHP